MAVGDRDRASGRTGDRGGSQAGETRDDRVVGMGLKQLRGRLTQVVDIGARGVERREQSQRVLAIAVSTRVVGAVGDSVVRR